MDKNRTAYEKHDIMAHYANLEVIYEVEKKIFSTLLGPTVNFLDIGIGGGRTTSYILPRVGKYTGIDYSVTAIKSSTEKFPNARILQCDARDLSGFEPAGYDVVNFSLNGLDYCNLNDRLNILKQVHRVLKPGGTFFFSTHNLCHPDSTGYPWNSKQNSPLVNLKTFIILAPYLWRKILKRNETGNFEGYAILNDHAHQYRLLTFYTSPPLLRDHLEAAGFGEIQYYTIAGQECRGEKAEAWIFVTCIKT